MRSILEILDGEGAWEEAALTAFAARNFVQVRRQGPLALLDYRDDLRTEHWNDFNRRCRGLIVDLEARAVVAWPFDKFFNLGQHPETQWEALPRDAGYEVAVKYDGSMLTGFAHAGRVRFATRSSFDNHQTRVAAEVADRRFQGLRRVDLGRYTPVFELVGPDNAQAVRYDETDLVLIGVRDRESGRMLGYAETAAFAAQHGLRPADRVPADLESLLRQSREGLGEFAEGWVVRFDTGLFVKVKTWQYLAHVQAQRMGLTRRRLVERFFQSEAEAWGRFVAGLPDPARAAVAAFGEALGAALAGFCAEVEALHARFAHLEAQKDYSLALQQHAPRELHPFLFARRAGRPLAPVARTRWSGVEALAHGEEVVTPAMIREWALTRTDL
jgi:hypothetical protein